MTACARVWSEMALADNGYSRFVQFAKIALPLLALGLLSTMFLFSRSVDIEDAIPMVDVDPQEIAREQRLAAPKFSGVTSDGSTITVTAETARPDLTDPKRLMAQNVAADIVTPTGTRYIVLSDDAVYDGNKSSLELVGSVRINTSTGYQLTTDILIANLAKTALSTQGMVEGSGPGGTLEAGRMELRAVDGKQVLVFKDGVKLVYKRQD